MIELGINRITDVDGLTSSTTIGIIQIDDTDPTAAPAILQPLDGHSLAVVLKVLKDIDAVAAATREAWS